MNNSESVRYRLLGNTVDDIMSQQSDRDLPLDLLRVVAAFAVVWLHAASRVVAINPNVYDANWWIGNFFDAISRWCVPVFVMISGALLLSKPMPLGEFYKKRLGKLLPVILFWSAFYAVVDSLLDKNFSIPYLVNSIVVGVPHYHLWFLYMIFGLYLAAPFIGKFLESSDTQLVAVFIVFAFLLGSIESIWSGLQGAEKRNTFFSSFLPFVGYFVAGHYLRRIQYEMTPLKAGLIIISVAAIIAILVGKMLPVIGEKSWIVMYAYLNPLVIVMSLCVYTAFVSLKIDRNYLRSMVVFVAPLTLGIYVIHPIFLAVLNKFVYLPFVGIPIVTIATFLLSLAATYGISKVIWLKKII